MMEPLRMSSDTFKYWQIDYTNNTMKTVFQDGRVVEGKLDDESSAGEHYIASSVFDWEHWWIFSTTTRGHTIITEGFNPNSTPPLNGRPSVYLDQNHWRTITDALRQPDRIANPAELAAAQDLIRLAVDGGVILPLSMGHMMETSGLHSEPRYEVGITMASLAGGWQIRNPLDLWKWEAEATMRSHLNLPERQVPPAISTEPGALYESGTNLGVDADTPDNQIFLAMLTMPNVLLSSLIEPESMPKLQLTRWVDRHAGIARQISSLDIPKDQRRRVARRRYWNENVAFYVAPYRALTGSLDSPIFSDRDLPKILSASPMVGLLSELFVRRFVDRQAKWKTNDLIDMFYLSSAAAYSNYVCAEKHTGNQLRDAQRALGRVESVFTSLHELVTAVRKDGAKTASERVSDSETDAPGEPPCGN